MKKTALLCVIFCVFALILSSCIDHAGTVVPQQVQNKSKHIEFLDFNEAEARSFVYPEITADEKPGRAGYSKENLGMRLDKFYKAGDEYIWDDVDDVTLWQSVIAGGGEIAIGFKDPRSATTYYKDNNYKRFNYARNYTLEFVLRELKKAHEEIGSVYDLEFELSEYLPIIWMQTDSYEVIAKLRKLPSVRYVEPLGEPLPEEGRNARMQRTASGLCDDVDSDDYYTYFENQGYNAKVSWHLYEHKVTNAWSVSNGRNITIGIIDTGISSDQTLLKSPKFSAGLSSGRSITKHVLGGDLLDILGHGTKVASIMAGPVNNDGGITGIAYRSSVVSYRIGADPWINLPKTKKNFNDALESLANNAGVRIINMSVGKFKHRASMEDAVDYAYGKGKLMVCSSGITGENGGVYPARFDNTIAVTSVKFKADDPLGIDLSNISPNPYGSYIDFAAYMLRESDDAKALMLKKSGYSPCAASGSSMAAATVSGIAALVWSANPYLTRDEVVEVLRNAASYQRFTNSKNSDFGYGVIDAYHAVLEAEAIGPQCRDLTANMSGPTQLNLRQPGTWTVRASGGCGTATYKWYNSRYGNTVVGTGTSYSTIMVNDPYMIIKVQVTKSSITRTMTRFVNCIDCLPEDGCLEPAVVSRSGNVIQLRIEPCPLELAGANSGVSSAVKIVDDAGTVIQEAIRIDNHITVSAELLTPGKYMLVYEADGVGKRRSFVID